MHSMSWLYIPASTSFFALYKHEFTVSLEIVSVLDLKGQDRTTTLHSTTMKKSP